MRNTQPLAGPGSTVSLSLQPLTPQKDEHKFFSGTGQPLSAHTFWRLTIQCCHRLNTAPSNTWLTDPKLQPSATAPDQVGSQGPASQLQNNPLSPGCCSQQKYQVKVQREPEGLMYCIPTSIRDSSIQNCINLSQKSYLHHGKIPCFKFCLSSFKHAMCFSKAEIIHK